MNLPRGGLIAAGVVLALVGAFVGGRFSAPEQIRYEEHETLTTHEATVYTKVLRVEVVKHETKVVVRDRIVSPDGTVREHEEERSSTDERAVTDAHEAETKTVEVFRDRDVVRTVTLRPDWRVGVLAGGSLQKPWLPIAGPLVLGIQVDRRIIGGLSAGVWANTGGAAGLAVAFEF